jgi:acetoacetate decarboxylase
MGFVKSMEELMANERTSADFFDAEMLSVFWETKPEIVSRLLPPPLKPAEYPLVMAFVADYPKTNFDVSYKETALFLRAVHDGVEGSYCLSMPVTNDMAMAGGRELFGFPKKMADIHFSKQNESLTGWTERRGTRFMEINAKLTGTFNDPNAADILMQPGNDDGTSKAVSYLYQFFPKPGGDRLDYNPWLIRQETLLRPKHLQIGEAEITLTHSDYDPWAEVEVVKMLGAVYTVGDNSMLSADAVVNVDPVAFLPYAFLRNDLK